MSEEKKFRIGLFGYNKKDVNSYLEEYTKGLNNSIKEKDNLIIKLKNQINEFELKNESVERKLKKLDEDKDQIISALIAAEQNAKHIIEQATQKASAIKYEIESKVDREKARLHDLRQDVTEIRHSVIMEMRKFEVKLAELTEETEIHESPNNP